MGALNVRIDDDLYNDFKYVAKLVYGDKQGVLKMAVEEALRMWIEKHKAKAMERLNEIGRRFEAQKKPKILDSFLGLARESVLEVKGLKIRIGFGKILIPLEQIHEVYSSEEFNDLLDRHKLYKTVTVVDDENFVVLIPKMFDEFTNTARKREMLKDWMAKNFKEFVKELVSLREKVSSQSQEAVE